MITRPTGLRTVRLVLCALVLFLLQVTISHRLTYGILHADLLYVLAAFLALEASEEAALWSALGIGLLRDLGSSGRLGGSAVLLVLGAAGLLHVRDRIFREVFVTDMVLVFAFALFCGAGHATGLAVAGRYAQWGALLAGALGQALVTAVLYPVFAFLFERAALLDRAGSGRA